MLYVPIYHANFDKLMFNISGILPLLSKKGQMIKIIPDECPTLKKYHKHVKKVGHT